MHRLCDEILQIILNQLDNPTSFSLVSRRFRTFTQDPYVRASYFLARYGRTQALYWALGRGKLINERVIDILVSSGAHLSRYLAQCAMHHYFRAQLSFIKTAWVRSLPLPVFSHFMTVAAGMYGDIPRGKGEDDASIFSSLLKPHRHQSEAKLGKWEVLKEVVEKYKFIPFCNKDPMMAQFPLVLAIEPRLLTYARANGFIMDRKYRNFVFRKIFEKQGIAHEGRANEIVQNVRELTRLDPALFLSRTVAAEVCMEAVTNEHAYAALKRLDREGDLKYSLRAVVEELIKSFANTRSISTPSTSVVIRELFKDYPSKDPVVRLVLLITIFHSEPVSLSALIIDSLSTRTHLQPYVSGCRTKFELLGLAPITRDDIYAVLVSKFTPERFWGILAYARTPVGLDAAAERALLREVVLACLEVNCKGKMVKRLVDTYQEDLGSAIAAHVCTKMRLELEDLPPWDDGEACFRYDAPLCREFSSLRPAPAALTQSASDENAAAAEGAADVHDAMTVDGAEDVAAEGIEGEDDDSDLESQASGDEGDEDLGTIGQETLTNMIKKDESAPSRRPRYYEMFNNFQDGLARLPYPADFHQVGRWVRGHYGERSAVAAVFMTHAVINCNSSAINPYSYSDTYDISTRVPITLKHFKMLARLGRCPSMTMYDDIQHGIEFYFSEEDYLSPDELSGYMASGSKARLKVRVKAESSSRAASQLPAPTPSPVAGPSTLPGGQQAKRRPRRSATKVVKSYVVPDSDDEAIAEGRVDEQAKKRKVETNLQRWIKHLSVLLREEQKKYKETKKRVVAEAEPGTKMRVPKSEFFKSLAYHLPRLKKADRDKRRQLYGDDVPDEDYSEGEEDEYQYRTTRTKRRKIEAED